MATAKSVDEYIDKLKQGPTGNIIANFLALFIGAIILLYALIMKGLPLVTYVLIVPPIGYLIWELSRRRKKLGERIWSILCPKCDKYIPLHQFECPPPCPKEYIDRSIIEGCSSCKTRYKKEGHDAFRHAVCDNCGYELEFSESYDFKPWSVLSKGQTWETETILISDISFYALAAVPMSFLGVQLGLAGLLKGFSLQNYNDLAMLGGIYLTVMASVFVLIEILLYGATRRIPNPTFKRNEEPKEIYVRKYGVVALEVIPSLLLLGSAIPIYVMLIKMYLLLDDPSSVDLARYTPFDVAWRIILPVLVIVFIAYHSTSFENYKKVPNPRYKEESS